MGEWAEQASLTRDVRSSAADRTLDDPTILLVDMRALVRECLARSLAAEWPRARVLTAGWDRLGAGLPSARPDLCVASLDQGEDAEARLRPLAAALADTA